MVGFHAKQYIHFKKYNIFQKENRSLVGSKCWHGSPRTTQAMQQSVRAGLSLESVVHFIIREWRRKLRMVGELGGAAKGGRWEMFAKAVSRRDQATLTLAGDREG